MMNAAFFKIRMLVNRWTTPTDPAHENTVRYWQDRLLFALLLAALVLGFIVYIPSVVLCIQERLWHLVVADTMIYGWVGVLFFRRSLPFAVRAYSIVYMTYALGMVLLLTRGSFAAGPVWLFAFPVLSAVFFGIRTSIMALVLNAFTIIAIGILYAQGMFPWGYWITNTMEKWVVVGINFLFLNAFVAISVGYISRGLMISLGREKATRNALELKHGELLNFNRQLEAEMAERRKAEEALMESEERYRALFDRSFELVFLCDFGGNILDGNDVLLDLMGYSRENLRSLNFRSILPEDQLPIAFDKLKEIQSTGSQRYPVEYRLKTKLGGDVYIEITGAVIHRDGKPYAVQGIGRDVTERKRQEVRRRELEGRLRQAQKMEAVGTLAGGIAHDFNNILTSVIGYTEMALEDVEKNSVLENYLKAVYQAGIRAKDLVRQILTFARRTDEKAGPTRVSSIAKEVLKMLRSAIPSTIEIRQDIQSDSMVKADPIQIHQILMNLATNAAQAMEDEGGLLKVLLRDEKIDKALNGKNGGLNSGTYLKIEVSDTGKGISEAHLDSIFDPYFTTKQMGDGTGLGLAVVHGIVSSYGGKISVRSKPDRGSVFTVYLPAVKSPGERHPVESETLPSGDERVLFVDDEVPITDMMRQKLERLGYSVITRNSSLEALELFRVKPGDFDLVITDMTMPDMTGEKLALKLLDIRPDIPIILCTGYSKRISDEIAADMGVKALLYKPVASADLAKAIREALDEAKTEFS